MKALGTALEIGWEMLRPGVRVGDNSYLKYLCVDLIGDSRPGEAYLCGLALRTLARRGIHSGDWLFARMCLERVLEIDRSPAGLVDAARLVLRMEFEGAWRGASARDVLAEALSRVNPDNSRPDLVAEIAFLLLTREPAAEKEAGELVQRTARSFPDQRRSILDRCVRLAEPRRPSRPSGRSFCANYPQGLPATQVSPSQVQTPAHDQYPGQLWVGQRSDS